MFASGIPWSTLIGRRGRTCCSTRSDRGCTARMSWDAAMAFAGVLSSCEAAAASSKATVSLLSCVSPCERSRKPDLDVEPPGAPAADVAAPSPTVAEHLPSTEKLSR